MKMVEAARKCGYLIVAVILLAPLARGQNANTGEIKGAVTDPSGASVPGVAVSVKDIQTSVVTSTTTNQAGLYDVPLLTPGNYSIRFSKSGFKDFVREGIVLHIETLEISATLQVGAASEEVLVSAAAPLVETETTDQHVELDTLAIASAPITGTDCCARVASGHAAAPPRSVMNSRRRIIRSPRRRPAEGPAAPRSRARSPYCG